MGDQLVASIPLSLTFFGGGVITPLPSNPYFALSIPAFFGGVRVISETSASLPVCVKRRDASGTYPVHGHPAATLLNGIASPGVNSYTARQVWATHAATVGNGYMRLYRDRGGRISTYRTLDPAKVTPFVDDDTGEKFFSVIGAKKEVILDSTEVAHLHGISYDGVRGIEPVALLTATFEKASLIEQYTRNYLRKGPHGGGVIEMPLGIKQPDIEAAKKNWRDTSGVENAGQTPVLSHGATYKPTDKSNSDAQLVELQRQVTNEVANILRISPTVLYQYEGAGKATSDNMQQEVLTFGIRNWVEQQESILTAAFLTEDERVAGMFIELEVDGLLRSDPLTRVTTVLPVVNAGLATPNWGADKLGLPPVEGGDVVRMPVAVSQPIEQTNKKAPPAGTETGGAT